MQNFKIAVTPITYIGWNSIVNLSEELKQLHNPKILLIADPVLVQLKIVEGVTTILEENHLVFDIYSNLIPEPTLQTGQDLVDFTRKGNYDLVIGFGGGSALDLAKLAAVFTQNQGDLKDYLNLTGSKKIAKRGIPKILIPTTSGTGTEVTNISVLALEKTKDVIVHDFLIADVAIVDPKFTLSIPPKVTAATGADALTHAIEAYVSVNANPYSNGLALQAIRLIGAALRTAVKNGADAEARTKMSYGSYLAGLAFFNAGVGAIHALAYPLGGQFHIAHGDSNAVLIPYVLNHIKNQCSEKLKDILEALGEKPGDDPATECVGYLKSLVHEIGIPETLAGFDIPESSLESLVEDGILQKRLLARCPVELTKEDIRKIYSAAFNGF